MNEMDCGIAGRKMSRAGRGRREVEGRKEGRWEGRREGTVGHIGNSGRPMVVWELGGVLGRTAVWPLGVVCVWHVDVWFCFALLCFFWTGERTGDLGFRLRLGLGLGLGLQGTGLGAVSAGAGAEGYMGFGVFWASGKRLDAEVSASLS